MPEIRKRNAFKRKIMRRLCAALHPHERANCAVMKERDVRQKDGKEKVSKHSTVVIHSRQPDCYRHNDGQGNKWLCVRCFVVRRIITACFCL